MATRVIILAQGTQSRLGTLPVAKQLLELPACGDTPIMHRTIRQLTRLSWPVPPGERQFLDGHDIVTVVCWLSMSEELVRRGVRAEYPANPATRYYPDTMTLKEPGNSSLKGIDQALRQLHDQAPRDVHGSVRRRPDRTVVLLGDVVYSWACLRAILDVGPPHCMRFVGTSDLSRSGGELWGLSWTWEGESEMLETLARALTKHPPFDDTYQPGQLRRWLWEVGARRFEVADEAAELRQRPWWTPIDDYTKDIDTPADLPKIPALSEAAQRDDAREGMTW